MPGSENSSGQAFFYVYVLESMDYKGEIYIGYTSDLKKRLAQHNKGFSISTKRYMSWQLIYYEACCDRMDAERREKYLKTSQGRRLLKRRLKEYFYYQTKRAKRKFTFVSERSAGKIGFNTPWLARLAGEAGRGGIGSRACLPESLRESLRAGPGI